MDTISTPAEAQLAMLVDGTEYSYDDLSFGEQRELRRVVRDLSGDPDVMPSQAALMDFLPAFVYLIKLRADPTFTVEKALELRYDDVVQDRPTQPAAKAKPKAK